MDKKEAEDFIQQCLVDNEKKKPKIDYRVKISWIF